MSESLKGFFSGDMEWFEKSLRKFDSRFNIIVGEEDYEKIDFPAIQYLPDALNYQDSAKYQSMHTLFFLFDKGLNQSNLIENVREMEKVLDYLMDASLDGDEERGVSSFPCAFNLIVDSVDFLVADATEGGLHVFQVVLRVRKGFDFAK